MQYRDLGRTGIRVSAIGFGAWAIGGATGASGTPLGWGRTSDDESLAAIRRARDLGVTFFDTADSYGFGRSESLLGIVLSRKRGDVVIATKVGIVRTAAGEMLQDAGKIRSWGVSISTPEEGMEIVERGWAHTIQVLYNVLNQAPARELFPAAQAKGYGIIARVPLASGLLTGKFRADS